MSKLEVHTISFIVISTVHILIIASHSQAQDSLCKGYDFYLDFPIRQMGQYSKVNAAGQKPIEAFTICVWLKTSDQHQIGLLRYFDNGFNDRIALSIQPGDGRLLFTILDEDRTLEPLPGVRDNSWHGVCVTWKSEGGVFMVYYDGRLIQEGNNFKAGVTLSPNRAFTAGVGKQDDMIYSGKLGHINAWPRVLEHPLLAVLSSKCGVESGELVSWPQFMTGVHGITAVAGDTCPYSESDVQDVLRHLRLEGKDDVSQFSLHYSAMYLEGRLDGHRALYLDETEAYVRTRSVKLENAFTIACWIKLMPSDPYYRVILRSEEQASGRYGFVFGVNSANQLQFENSAQSSNHVYTAGSLHEKQWIHVAVAFGFGFEVSLFINGFNHSQTSSLSFPWKILDSILDIGRYQDPSNSNYRYFHGYLSDLYIIGRTLSAAEIGKIMGRSLPCTHTEWTSPPASPGQKPAEKYRNMTCPGIGQCKEVGTWRPTDCREVLLAVNRTNGVYTISPLNNEEEFQVFCDHETQGGGWTVIQRRKSLSENFARTWAEYKTGFGTVDGQSDMWLGNEKIHALTTQDTELLIQLEAADGSKGYAIYDEFRVGNEDARYQLSLGIEFSGNLPNTFSDHRDFNFVTQDSDSSENCSTTQGGGWWFTNTNCGNALLNSASMKWNGFPTPDSPVTVAEMKIRRKKGFSGDYSLKFPSGSRGSYLIWPNILTEFKAFSACFWLRFRPPSHQSQMQVLRYTAQDGNFSVRYNYAVAKLQLTLWPSTEKRTMSSKSLLNDDIWHHACWTWKQDQGLVASYVDSSQEDFSGKATGATFKGGGKMWIGNVYGLTPQFEGEITYMNIWDMVLSKASVQNLANSCGSEAGNVLHWSFFAAMIYGDVQISPYSSVFPKELYHWTFDRSSSTESFDVKKNHKANMTGARISADRPSVVIEDEGHIVSEIASSDLTTDKGVTVSFSVKQTVMTSDILQDDFQNLELLRTTFPPFIRDNAMWKRCYSADQTSWRTAEFHSSCDHKGPSLTVIGAGEYVFGGFVEQSWGGPAADIGNQYEGFLFSLSNPFNESPRVLPILQGKTAARTDPLQGPSFGQRDLELFEDATGRLKGFSGLGVNFNISTISLSGSGAGNYFTGSRQFYPEKVEVFYYHVPSTPVGLESFKIQDSQITSSSDDGTRLAKYARLNEARSPGSWCTSNTAANSWLQVFLGKQYTLTHIALQGVNNYDVKSMTVKYENTKDGGNWTTYSKSVGGSSIAKVVRFKALSQGEILKEAFFPPFGAVKVKVEVEGGNKCMKMELYFYEAGCSQAYGVEDGTIPDEKLSSSSLNNPTATNKYNWPFRGRLNHNAGSAAWGPYRTPASGNWFQVDLQNEKEVTCIATQGRFGFPQYTTQYQVSYSTNGHEWRFYANSMGEKELPANSDQYMTVTNCLFPSIYGRFIRLHLTACNTYCRVRVELYGNRSTSEILPSGHGLFFKIRQGRHHISFAKGSSVWQIRHPLIFNKWFKTTLTWNSDNGLKFYVNGKLMASDTSRLNVPDISEPLMLWIGSEENSGGWSRSIAIDDVSVWSMALSDETIKRESEGICFGYLGGVQFCDEVFLDFDDSSRNWTSFMDGSSDWKLAHGCTAAEGTGPCDDVSGGGRYIYFQALNSSQDYGYTARFVIPLKLSSAYSCVKFHYHMSGIHVGRLNVYSTDLHGKENLLWRLFGDQNNTWNEASFPVNVSWLQYQIILEAQKGKGYLGDIAIDHITFTRETCSLVPLSAAAKVSASSGVVIKSSIVRMDSSYHQHLGMMLKEEGHDSTWWIPCYHALAHGWEVSSFHQHCDNKGPTLTIVRKENYVFGGFTERSWGDSTYELSFKRKNSSDYVKSQLLPPISTLTASLWIKSSNTFASTLFTFGPYSRMVQVVIVSAGAAFCIWSSHRLLCSPLSFVNNVNVNDGVWHHLAVVWESTSNRWELHLDGVFQGEKNQPQWNSQIVPGGGDLLIGQNHHPTRTQTESFMGQITSFNMWNYKWERSAIASLAESCGSQLGNVFQWHNIQEKLHGEVKLEHPTSCKARSSYDLHFWRKHADDYIQANLPASLSEFTVSLWLKSFNMTGKEVLFSLGNIAVKLEVKIKHYGQKTSLCLNHCNIIALSSNSGDGLWHQFTVGWKGDTKQWKLYKDGILQGEKNEPQWSTNALQGILYIGRRYFEDSEQSFAGLITSFNMWNSYLPGSQVALFAQNCRKEQGNVFQWINLKGNVRGQLKVVEPSSCSSTSYKSDGKAFIFSLNYTSQGSLFKKKISEVSSSTAIYSFPSTGPTFGEAPFDFQIGANGSMREGTSHHIRSYTDGRTSSLGSNMQTLLAGASIFNVSDVEVLYKGLGGSLCDQPCPYSHYCDEIQGGCRCKHESDIPLLCRLYKFYHECSHFWPLESVENIEDVVTHTWGQAKGGVFKAGGLLTDGVSGEVQLLDHAGASCATQFLGNAVCGDLGFTVALRLKYFNRMDGQKQVLFKTFHRFVIYQERKDSIIVRIELPNKFCLKEITMPEKIWSHLVFTFKSVNPKILTVFRNGQKLDEFIRDLDCESQGQPQFVSSTVSLGVGLGVFAKAVFDDVAIWNKVLSDEGISELSNANINLFPFKVRVVVRITNQSWHDDLYYPGSARYNAMTKDITNNVTGFYSSYPEVNLSVIVDEYRPASVKANFTIEYNVKNFSLIEELNNTISKTGHLYNMPLEIIELTTEFIPSVAPPNLHATSVFDSSIDIAWQDPSLSPSLWEVFQGYKIFIRPLGSAEVNIVTINAQQNFATLPGLKSLVTYNMSVAAYTFAGVGRQSESISITTTLDAAPVNVSVVNVTSSCVRIRWDAVPLEKIGGIFRGYQLNYTMAVSDPHLIPGEHVTDNFTHEVEICHLQSFTKYKFAVRRYLLNKMGNWSDLQYFTTLEQVPRHPPTNVECYNASSTILVVQWQAASMQGMGGSFIRGYEVFFKPRAITPPKWNTILACNSTFKTSAVELEKYTEYEIQVTAFNGEGSGNYSEIVHCFTDEDVPLGGPTNITAHNASSTSIAIHWSPVPKPLRLGIIIRYIFNVTEVLTGHITVATFDGAALNGTVGNLSKYTEYTIRGAAVNSKGQSNFTNEVTGRTSEDAPDLPPVNVTAYNTSSTSIMIEFQASSVEQLNGIIRKFTFFYFKVGDTNATVRKYTADRRHSRRRRQAPTTNNTFQSELRGLEEYTTFSIQVSFVTVKEGPFSAWVNVSTDEGVPRAPPLQVIAFNSSTTSIMVTWQNLSAATVPGILLGYVVSYVKADDINAANLREVKQDLKTYRSITNLEAYTLYNISVAGYTRTGTGNFSLTQSWTDEGVPEGPPNNLTRSSLSTKTIGLTWIPVTKELRKGIIQGYQLYMYGASGYVSHATVVAPSLTAVFGGLTLLSNYSVKARAFTRKGFGPWSPLFNTSTGAGAPDKIPMNATAKATSATTIHVTWSPVSLANARVLQAYRIKFFAINQPQLIMYIMVSKNSIQADLTRLRPFTVYSVQVAAFGSEDGNFTSPLIVKTWEGVPTVSPSKFGVSVLDSQTMLVHWLEVPPEHHNGIIRGYGMTYWNARNGTSPEIILPAYTLSYVLRPLQKATEYVVRLWAFTSAGKGTVGSRIAMTSEDVPSKPPPNIVAHNKTSLTRIPIKWEPVPQEFIHGYLAGYRVTYQAAYVGDLPVDSAPVISEDVGPAVTSMTLRNLEPLVVYRITVAARTNKGAGPNGVTFGETCRCRPHLTTNWRNYPPYVNLTSLSNPGIIIPKLLVRVIDRCCGHCQEHNRSELDFTRNGNNKTAQQTTVADLRQNIDLQTDFSFPVIGYKLQDTYKGGLGYAPFVESAGVAYLVYTDTTGLKDSMFSALLACWPVVAIPMIIAYIAGVFVWVLDARSNQQHFPGSFIYGTWEGVWWAFVSMTTVGYGDRCPTGPLGRMFAVGWVLTGLVIISVTMGALTTALTTITEGSIPTIYGSKVGAIHGSPEYNLGVRRNAIMNRDKHYHTLEELSEALVNREVDGILIDTYAGGTRKDLFTKPSLIVAQIIDYQTAYGVVIGGDSMRLRHCFYGYMRSHQAEIFSWVEKLVEPITGSGLSDEEFVKEISTGLFDSDGDLFRNTLLITSTCAVTAVVLGLCFEAVRRIRGRAKVQQDKSLSVHKDKMVEEMRSTVADFLEHSTDTLRKMKSKYKKALLIRAKLSPKGIREVNSPATASSALNSKEDDDISVISLEDEHNDSSKC